MYFFQTSGEVVQSLTDIKCALKNHGVLSNGVIDRNDSLSPKVCSLSSPKEFVLQINNGYDLQCMYYKKKIYDICFKTCLMWHFLQEVFYTLQEKRCKHYSTFSLFFSPLILLEMFLRKFIMSYFICVKHHC